MTVAAAQERVTWVALAVTRSEVGAFGGLPMVVRLSTVEAVLVPTAVMVETLKQ